MSEKSINRHPNGGGVSSYGVVFVQIFGAFCSAYWRERKQSTKNLSYFGTGETFVFTLSPEKKKYDWVGLKEENIPRTANMFQAGDRHVLIVGGG